MKLLLLLCCLFSLSSGQRNARHDGCYSEIITFCREHSLDDSISDQCTASFGAGGRLYSDLNVYVTNLLGSSFDYLLMSTRFTSFEKRRPGFERLFRQMSDTTWNEAIDVMKYITVRGGIVDFRMAKNFTKEHERHMGDLNELSSLSFALDSERNLLEEAGRILGRANYARRGESYDPALTSYMKVNAIARKADSLRFLSGSIHTLHAMTTDSWQRSVALYLFDDRLNKANLIV